MKITIPLYVSKLILIYLIITSSSFAQTSWTGAISSDWGTAGNWSLGVPTSLVDAAIGDQVFLRQPIINSNAVCKSLTIGGVTSSTLTVNSLSLTISGNLSISLANTLSQNSTVNLLGNLLNSGTFTSNSTLNIGGNFTNSGTFNAGTSSIIINGSGAQTISSTASFNNLTVNKASGAATALSNINISGILNFIKGNVTTGSNQVIIGTTGSVTEGGQTTGWVNGKLTKPIPILSVSGTINFEIGDSTNYTNISSVFLQVSLAGTLTVSTNTPDHPNISSSGIDPNKSVNRYYTLTNNGIIFNSATTTLNWVSTDVDASASTSNFKVANYNGSTWSSPITTANPNPTSIQATTSSFGDFAVGELITSGSWTGAISTEWNLATNWSTNAIPASTTNVTINSAGVLRFPIVSTAIAFVKDLIIGSGASVTVSGQTLKISGSITNSGNFIASSGIIELNGSSPQTIPANTFANKLVSGFRISNTSASGVSLADTVAIKDSVSFGNINNAVLNSNGFLTIKSTATYTGRVADLTNKGANTGNTINGNVTVERYIPVSNMRGYRFLAPSVNSAGTIHANWQEGATSSTNNPKPGYGTHITGTKIDQTNGFDGTQTGAQSFYTYNPTTDAFVSVANTNTLKLIAPTSYILYFRGNRSIDLTVSFANQGSSSTTLRATGILVQGASLNTSTTVASTASNGGFSLISNPYAAPLSWLSLYNAHSSSLSNYYTYYDPKFNGGVYVTVTTAGVTNNPSSTATADIQSGQAFFVHATSTAPSITFQESYKSTNNSTGVFTAKSAPQLFYTSLFINDALGRRNADGVVNMFDSSNNNAIDGNDADEIENFAENIAINKLNHHLAIEQLAYPTTHPDTIRYYMSNMVAKNYDLEFKNSDLDRSMTAQLVDNFTGTKTNLSFDTATIYPFTVTSATASYASTRFYVVLNPVITLPVTLINFTGNKKEAGVELQWQTSREINADHYEIERSFNGNDFNKIGAVSANGNSSNVLLYNYFDAAPTATINYYRLKIIDKNGEFTYSKIIQVRLNEIASSMNVYPNPVIGNTMNLQLNDVDKGTYQIYLVNKLGQETFTKTINHLGGSANQSIHIDYKIPKGLYQLKIGQFSIPVMIQ